MQQQQLLLLLHGRRERGRGGRKSHATSAAARAAANAAAATARKVPSTQLHGQGQRAQSLGIALQPCRSRSADVLQPAFSVFGPLSLHLICRGTVLRQTAADAAGCHCTCLSPTHRHDKARAD